MAHRLHGAKKAGLLFELSQGCLLDGLTSIDEASWELDARPTRARSELGHKNDLLGSLFPTNYGDNPDLSTHCLSNDHLTSDTGLLTPSISPSRVVRSADSQSLSRPVASHQAIRTSRSHRKPGLG